MGAKINLPEHIDLIAERSKPLDASDVIRGSDGTTKLELCRAEVARLRKVIRDIGRENGMDPDFEFGDENKK